ncbi:MAG: pyridoxal phosphate-dependent decarboxylase family protein [Candidatus Odinarchaeota archaeon]
MSGDPHEIEEFRKNGHFLIDYMADFYADLSNKTIIPPSKSYLEIKNTSFKREGMKFDNLFQELERTVIEGTMLQIHPRFFGFVPSAGLSTGSLADLLISFLNQNAGRVTGGPSASLVEDEVIRWIAEVAGLPDTAGGTLVSGGSIANLTAMVVARDAASPGIPYGGVATAEKRLVAYASDQVHFSVEKALDICGIGRKNLRLIETDEKLKLIPSKLRKAIDIDIDAGYQPFCVIGTAGTTTTGAIDPLEDIAKICRNNNLWFHVDGAYGGFARLIEEGRQKLRGIELADSITLDPHKWLLLPYDIGCIIVKDLQALEGAFSIVPSYLEEPSRNENSSFTNYYKRGIQLSRQFRALKVWMALKYHGTDFFAQNIEVNCKMALLFYSKINGSENFETLPPPELSVVCFRFKPSGFSEEEISVLNKRLYCKLKAAGNAFFSSVIVRQKYYLRACFINYRTTPNDVELAHEEIVKTAISLIKS